MSWLRGGRTVFPERTLCLRKKHFTAGANKANQGPGKSPLILRINVESAAIAAGGSDMVNLNLSQVQASRNLEAPAPNAAFQAG